MEEKIIPSLNFDDNKIVVETFEVPLIFNEKEIKIKMARLTAGQKQEIVKTNAQMKLVGTQQTGSIDSVGYMISVLSKVIIEAPFDISYKVISELPENILQYLFEEYAAFANDKKKD